MSSYTRAVSRCRPRQAARAAGHCPPVTNGLPTSRRGAHAPTGVRAMLAEEMRCSSLVRCSVLTNHVIVVRCAAASASERPSSVQNHALHLRTKSVSSLKSFARSQCSSLRQPSFARLLRCGLRLEGLPCVLCFSAPLHEGRGRCACCPVLRQISIWERWKSTAELRVAVPAAASRADWVLYI